MDINLMTLELNDEDEVSFLEREREVFNLLGVLLFHVFMFEFFEIFSKLLGFGLRQSYSSI